MTRRIDCPPAAAPLEEYAACVDDLFNTAAQCHSFRDDLAGLLLPGDRTNTLPVTGGA